jgi:hypothetical protein
LWPNWKQHRLIEKIAGIRATKTWGFHNFRPIFATFERDKKSWTEVTGAWGTGQGTAKGEG